MRLRRGLLPPLAPGTTSHYKLMFSSIYSLILTITYLDNLRVLPECKLCQFSNGFTRAGTEIGVCLPIHGTKICSHLWMSTRSLAVYPPMSHWVYALTFLRITSQGVDAVSCSFTGSLPLRCRCYGLSMLLLVLVFHR